MSLKWAFDLGVELTIEGPIMMLTLAEYFSRNPLSINLE